MKKSSIRLPKSKTWHLSEFRKFPAEKEGQQSRRRETETGVGYAGARVQLESRVEIRGASFEVLVSKSYFVVFYR